MFGEIDFSKGEDSMTRIKSFECLKKGDRGFEDELNFRYKRMLKDNAARQKAQVKGDAEIWIAGSNESPDRTSTGL
jgi:hypothetical protein